MNRQSDTALLIINYGTPEDTGKRKVAKYLRELLNSSHVMVMKPLARKILVNCIIVPSRAKYSAGLYSKIKTQNGEMPLNVYTMQFVKKIQNVLQRSADVYIGMTAGSYPINDVVEQIVESGYSKLVIAPMFPQYTESTWGKALDSVYSALSGKLNLPTVNCIDPFYNNEYYIDSVVKSINDNVENIDDYERIICSYHGVPTKHLTLTHKNHTCEELDCQNSINENNFRCYCAQCFATTRLIAKQLGVSEQKFITAFQSRLTDRWIKPFTDTVVRELASQGIKRVAVVSPSFVVDCLETILELNETLKNTFLSLGGQEFKVIPCLNAEDYWTQNFCSMIKGSL